MLTSLALSGFKPFGAEQVAPLARITLLYGPNSGGKSSLLQALLLLRQTLEASSGRSSALVTRGPWVDLGSFRALVHRHALDRQVTFALGFDRGARGGPGRRTLPPGEGRRVTLAFEAASPPGGRTRDTSALASVRYELDEGRLLDVTLRRTPEPRSRSRGAAASTGRRLAYEWRGDSDRLSYALYVAGAERRLRETLERLPGERPAALDTLPAPPAVEALERSLERARVAADSLLPGRLEVALDGEAPADLARLAPLPLESLAAEAEELLGALVYLGPLRSHPARQYLTSGGATETVGVRGEATTQVLFRHRREVAGTVNGWLERLEIPYRLSVKRVGDALTGELLVLSLVDRRTGVDVAPADVGFGIGQLLPIVVQGLVARDRLLCVEQPEIHLHPRLAAAVADLVIETSRHESPGEGASGGPGNQWIVETHSEALVLRLQRRIREGTLAASEVSVLYVEPLGASGSRIVPLRLDSDGEWLNEWPGGFFEESFRELFGDGG